MKRKIFTILIIVFITVAIIISLFFFFHKQSTNSIGNGLLTSSTVFSVGVNAADGVVPNPDQKVEVLQKLHVSTTRMQVSTITDSDQPMNREATAYQKAGISILLNMYNKDTENGMHVTNNVGREKTISNPPTDIALYQTEVGKLLDIYHPKLVVIENEENGKHYSGTPEEYITQLNVATITAHQKGYKIANGGITGIPLALMVWKDYWDKGQYDQAATFAKEVFNTRTKAADIYAQLPTVSNPKVLFPPKIGAYGYNRAIIEIPLLKDTAIDYVNFHYYLEDPQAFAQIVTYLKRVTGKPVIANEVGQQDTDPKVVTDILNEAVLLQMSYLNWFSTDVAGVNPDPDIVAAKALHNGDLTLRPNGTAFANFMSSVLIQ